MAAKGPALNTGPLKAEESTHPIQLAGEAHYRLVTIHPFTDGNVRTARLLMNMILLMTDYPPAIIKPQERLAYITSLKTARLGSTKEPVSSNHHKCSQSFT